MAGSRTILHVDMDAFYAAVEQRQNPDLRGKPVIVGADPQGGRGRGVVAACSYEARRYGIRSALPISRAFQLCPQGSYVRPNGSLYRQVSASIMAILKRFTDLIEPISIDEAFLDVSGSGRLFGSGEKIARTIKFCVFKEQGLTCSIGVATNKLIAKIASDLCKPDGLCQVPAGQEETFLADLPVGRIWGVGSRLEGRLKSWGVQRIGDIASREPSFWQEKLGRHGTRLWTLSRGIDPRPVEPQRDFKSLSHELTFETDCADVDRIRRALLSLSEKVARRCRQHGLRGSCVRLKWRFEDFSTFTRQRRLKTSTDDGRQIFNTVVALADSFLPLKRKVRLVGVGLTGFVSATGKAQRGLFQDGSQERKGLHQSVDLISERFGEGAIRKASLLGLDPDEEGDASSFLTH